MEVVDRALGILLRVDRSTSAWITGEKLVPLGEGGGKN